MKLLLFFLLMASACSPKLPPPSTGNELTVLNLAIDTLLPKPKALDLPLNVPVLLQLEGQPLVLTNTADGLRIQGSRQLIRERETKYIPVPTGKTKNIDRSTHTTAEGGSLVNQGKLQDRSTDKSNTNSKNRQKEKKSDPFSLFLIILLMALLVALILWLREKFGIKRGLF